MAGAQRATVLPRSFARREPDPTSPINRLVDENGAVVFSAKPMSSLRMGALAFFGLLIGAGVTLIGSSFVRAGSESGLFELVPTETKARREAAARVPGLPDTPSRTVSGARPVEGVPVHSGPIRPTGVRLSAPDRLLGPDASGRMSQRLTPIVMRTPGTQQMVGGMSRRTVCVRLCDGFHFPIGRVAANESLAGHESMCRAMCPGAPVRLFTIPAGQDGIENAVSDDGRSYRQLPMAYAHERGQDSACSCELAEAAPQITLLTDPTLRKGDAVVTEAGVKVFGGREKGQPGPAKREDFSEFRQSRALAPSERGRIDQIVGASQRDATLKNLKRKAQSQAVEARRSKKPQPGTEQPILIRSGNANGERLTVRVITPSLFSQPR